MCFFRRREDAYRLRAPPVHDFGLPFSAHLVDPAIPGGVVSVELAVLPVLPPCNKSEVAEVVIERTLVNMVNHEVSWVFSVNPHPDNALLGKDVITNFHSPMAFS